MSGAGGRTALRVTWLATRATGAISAGLGGRFAERLRFTPWPVDAGPRSRARHAAWLEDADPLSIPFRGGRLAGFAAGTGPVVLLVHGRGERAASLGAFVRPLTDAGFRVVGVDLPAHGDSPGRRTSLPEQAAALRAASEYLGDIHGIVAHSMGGLASVMALREGLEARAATLLAPAVRLGHALSRWSSMFAIPPKATLGLAAVIERRFGHDVWETFAGDKMAPDVTVPTLIVQDRDDQQVDHSDAVLLADAWPGSRLLTTEGLGYNRVLRDPEVIASVSAFMSSAAIAARAS